MASIPERWRLAVAFAGGLAFGGGAGAWLAARRPAPSSALQPAAPPAGDPSAYLPTGARGVVIADVARMRRAPALQHLFEQPRAGEPCETRLLRRVRRVAVALEGAGSAEFGLAFTGDLPREELLACARERGSGGEAQSDRYRGLELVRVAPRVQPGLLPRTASEIVYLPGGTVITGGPELVRRMVDRGLAGPPTGAERATQIAELRQRIGTGHTAEFAMYFGGGGARPTGPLEEAFRHVVGVAAGATFEPGLRAVAVFACDDYDAPRSVANALEGLRDELLAELPRGALERALRAATFERRAGDVVVRLELDARGLESLVDALGGVMEMLSSGEAAPLPARATVRAEDGGADAGAAPDAR